MLKWVKCSEGCWELESPTYCGIVEMGGEDMFHNSMIYASAWVKDTHHQLPLGNMGVPFTSIDGAKAAIRNAIHQYEQEATQHE